VYIHGGVKKVDHYQLIKKCYYNTSLSLNEATFCTIWPICTEGAVKSQWTNYICDYDTTHTTTDHADGCGTVRILIKIPITRGPIQLQCVATLVSVTTAERLISEVCSHFLDRLNKTGFCQISASCQRNVKVVFMTLSINKLSFKGKWQHHYIYFPFFRYRSIKWTFVSR